MHENIKRTGRGGQNLLKDLETILKKDKRFVSNEGELQKNTIIEAGLKPDSRLLELLAKNEKTKKAFFKAQSLQLCSLLNSGS